MVNKRVNDQPSVNKRLIELAFEMDDAQSKKRGKKDQQEVTCKRMLLVDYRQDQDSIQEDQEGTELPQQDNVDFSPVVKKQSHKAQARLAQNNPVPQTTLKQRKQPKEKSTQGKSRSRTPKKNTLTPPVDTGNSGDMLKRLIPTVNDKAFYHDICKRPADTLRGKSEKRIPSPAPARRMTKTRSVPRVRDNFFDKKVEFYVKMYRKLEDTTSRGRGAAKNLSSDDILRNTQKVRTLQDTMSRYNKNTQTSTLQDAKALARTAPAPKKMPVLKPEQFCNFCDNYFHEKCFDDFVKNNHH